MKMEAGLELDALVSQSVMGWKIHDGPAHLEGSREYPHGYTFRKDLHIYDGERDRVWKPEQGS